MSADGATSPPAGGPPPPPGWPPPPPAGWSPTPPPPPGWIPPPPPGWVPPPPPRGTNHARAMIGACLVAFGVVFLVLGGQSRKSEQYLLLGLANLAAGVVTISRSVTP